MKPTHDSSYRIQSSLLLDSGPSRPYGQGGPQDQSKARATDRGGEEVSSFEVSCPPCGTFISAKPANKIGCPRCGHKQALDLDTDREVPR